MQVSLNVYDVTNTTNENTNVMITRLNNITRELSLGGVFHGAIQIEDAEWSFGYCDIGTGVYCCRARSNSLYTFREHIELGETHKTKQEIREILSRFKRTWPGNSYDLLKRNCCHFCEELCVALDVPKPPAWLNRFAAGADATVKFTNDAQALAKRVSSNLSITAQQSASWFRDVSSRVMSQISQSSSSFGAGGGSAPESSADDDGSDDTPHASPLYGRSVSPTNCCSSSERSVAVRQPAFSGSTGRLTSRLRPFSAQPGGGGAGAGGGAGGSGLPASTPASSGDLAAAAQQQQQQNGRGGARAASPSPSGAKPEQSLASALKQKWQELEAAAATEGTKQFLFGLIKTRQTRLEEDEAVPAGGGAPASAAAAAGDRQQDGAASAVSVAIAGAGGGAESAGPGHSFPGRPIEPTQPPAQQVIVDSLLPGDVVGGARPPAATAATATAAAVTATITSVPPQAATDVGPGLIAVSVTPVAAAAPPLPPPPSLHLLDM